MTAATIVVILVSAAMPAAAQAWPPATFAQPGGNYQTDVPATFPYDSTGLNLGCPGCPGCPGGNATPGNPGEPGCLMQGGR